MFSEEEWDRWVENHPDGRYVYLSGYRKVIKELFNFPSFSLVKKEKNEIKAVLPLFLLRRLKGEKILISLPFSEYGGPLGEGEIFLGEIKQILKETKAKFLEIHGGVGIKGEISQFKILPLLHYATLNLGKKKLPEILDRVDYSVKKNIRKAWKEKLHIRREREIKKSFYSLYLISHRRLGSPPLPFKFFSLINSYLYPYIRVISIYYHGKIVSSLLGWSVGKSFHITHIASDHHFWNLRGNDLAHIEMIKWALEERKEIFDFGPARYEGQIRYKKKWGVDFHPYKYLYYPREIQVSPPQPEKGIYPYLRNLWKLSVPDFLSPFFGKFVRGHLGI